jgi:peptide/nickel transport system permease protein
VASAALDAVPESFDTLALRGKPRPAWRSFLRSLLRRKVACVALAYIAAFYLCALFAPLLAPYSYAHQDLHKQAVLQGPSLHHLLGTDRLGRDLLSRVIYATRTTALISIAATLTGGFLLSTGLGMLAAYRGGWVDSLINRVGEALGSVPDLLVALLLAATLRPRFDGWVRHAYSWPLIGSNLRTGIGDIFFIFLILTPIGWVGGERLIRSQALQVRSTDYVLAARAMGASVNRILWQHVFTNIRHLVVLDVTTSLGAVALAEIALSFFGLGVRDPTPSFGAMIFDAGNIRALKTHPHLLMAPGLIAILFFLAFALLGDALNDVLNPRTR